jgi:lipopolysaccharide transport protein LptA
MKAKLTRATILTKDDLMTSDEPVIVEFPNGSIRSNHMTLRQKAREATFSEAVAVEITQPADAKPKDPSTGGASPEEPAGSTLFAPSNGPINIDASRLDLNDAKKVALFTGEVRARQGDANLTTPELEVTYEGDGFMGASGAPKDGAADQGGAAAPQSPAGKVKRIFAKKPVVMKRANGDVVTSDTADFDAQAQTAVLRGEVIMTSGTDRRATGDRVEINDADSTVFLIGNVAVSQAGNLMRGERLEIDRKRGTAALTTPAEGAADAGRITAHLIRTGDTKTPTAAAKDAGEKKSDAASEAKGDALAAAGGVMAFKTDPKAPIDIEADRLDVDDQTKVAVFRGDVDANQGGFKIACSEMHAFYKGDTGLMDAANPAAKTAGQKGSELTRIEAKKDVRVTSKEGQTATGDWANFDAKTNMVTMGGNVVLSRGKSMVRGTRLLIDMTTGESKIDTAPQNTVTTPGGGGWLTQTPAEPATEAKGRASAVFFPQELKEGEEKGDKDGKGAKSKGAKSEQSKPAAPTAAEATDGWSATADPGGAAKPAN